MVAAGKQFPYRRSFGRIKKTIEIPHLLEIQRVRTKEFLQRVLSPENRADPDCGCFSLRFPDQGL